MLPATRATSRAFRKHPMHRHFRVKQGWARQTRTPCRPDGPLSVRSTWVGPPRRAGHKRTTVGLRRHSLMHGARAAEARRRRPRPGGRDPDPAIWPPGPCACALSPSGRLRRDTKFASDGDRAMASDLGSGWLGDRRWSRRVGAYPVQNRFTM